MVEEAQGAVLIAKTRADQVAALSTRVRELHTDQVPCVVAFTIAGGDADYLAWLARESS